ncbi:MAG TPA: hypothetical protein VGF63_05920 [Solirubrobacteraceae bacterium]
MAHSEARAWWVDVQHLRDDYERTDEARRRADEADLATRRATRERRHVEAEMRRVSGPLHSESGPPRRAPEPALAPRRGQHADTHPRHDAEHPIEPRRPRVKGSGTPGRATIELRGHTVPAPAVPRVVDPERRRPARRPIERVGARPDRVAMWALLMGLILILVAIGTADAPAVISLTPL